MNELEIKRSKYPRVSEIIGKQNEVNMRGIPLEVLANAAERGRNTHTYCTMHANGLFLPTIEENCKKAVDTWIEWFSLNVEEVLMSEIRLYDDEWEFSGEPDFLLRLKSRKKIALLDIKTTSTVSITWGVQLSAYERLCEVNGIPVEETDVLHLKKNSKGEVLANLIEYPDLKPYRNIFESSLRCFKFFNNKGELL